MVVGVLCRDARAPQRSRALPADGRPIEYIALTRHDTAKSAGRVNRGGTAPAQRRGAGILACGGTGILACLFSGNHVRPREGQECPSTRPHITDKNVYATESGMLP